MKNGRCRMHGGTNPGAPKGNQNARKHGIYSHLYSVEEQAILDTMELGKVDEEIKLCRIRLLRAMDSERISKQKGETKLQTYNILVDRLLSRIESLERTRSELFNRLPAGTGDIAPPAQVIISVVDARKPDANPQ